MESLNDPFLIFWRSFGDLGFVLVIIGVIGEVAAAIIDFVSEKRFNSWHEKWKSRLRLTELFAGGVLIVGLAMEYRGHKRETQILDSYNAASYSNSVALSMRVEELRQKNNELEESSRPMRIANGVLFETEALPFADIMVNITNSPTDERAHATAFEIAERLKQIGWNVSRTLGDRLMGVRIKFSGDENGNSESVKAANILQRALTYENIPVAMYPTDSNIVPSNTVLIEVGQRPDPDSYAEIIARAQSYAASRDFWLHAGNNPPPNSDTEAVRLADKWAEAVLRYANLVRKQRGSHVTPFGVSTAYGKDGDSLTEILTYSNGVPIRVSELPDIVFLFSNGNPEFLVIKLPDGDWFLTNSAALIKPPK